MARYSRADGLEQHMALMSRLRDVEEIGHIMTYDPESRKGQEAFADSLQQLGSGVLSVTKWVGGKALSGLTTAIQAAGKGLSKAFDDNKSAIRKGIGGVKDSAEYTLSANQVGNITSKGDLDHIGQDLDKLLAALEKLDKHGKAVLDHLDAQLLAVRKLQNAKHTDDVIAVVDAIEKLKYPAFDIGNQEKGAYHSELLPGGKQFVFSDADGHEPKYSMSGDTPAGEGGTLSYSKSQVAELLNKLDKVNALHQRAEQSYEAYLKFIRSWSEMVKAVDEHLGTLEYKVSKSVLAEAEKLLAGNPGALAFYSGFIPRVVGYTDRYIHGVLGVFA